MLTNDGAGVTVIYPMKTFHVGPHKTASSYLQRHVFPYIDGVTYLSNGDIKKCWQKDLASDAALPPNLLYSMEAALGWPYPIAEVPKYKRFFSLCDALGVSQLIMVRRNYPSWVLSLWYQTINEWGDLKFSEWYAKNPELEEWRYIYSRVQSIAAERGMRVFVVNQEDIRESPAEVAGYIGRFCGGPFNGAAPSISENRSIYNCLHLRTLRALNKFFGRIEALRRPLDKLRVSPRFILQSPLPQTVFNSISRSCLDTPQELQAKDWL